MVFFILKSSGTGSKSYAWLLKKNILLPRASILAGPINDTYEATKMLALGSRAFF
jgi:hypothetical protein